MTAPVRRLAAFAIAAPGLEPWVARELAALGLPGHEEPGGVSLGATVEDIQRANLWSRLASRIVVRVAEFHARALGELARRAGAIPWEEWLVPGTAVRVRVTARKSRLYHTGAIAERVLAGIAARTPVSVMAADAPADDDESDADDAQLLIVRLAHDVCTISLDSSGALLHRRGYRQAVARAPLRETLAAAMLASAGWRPSVPLADPLCGAGTIAIEAAMQSRAMAPGLGRRFAFERWPGHDARRWQAARDAARERIRPAVQAPIHASDRDAGAIAAARSNAERAGVVDDVQLTQHSLSAAPLGEAGSWIVTNPPYGIRVGESSQLRNLYAVLGRRARDGGHPLVLLSADPGLERQLGVPLETVCVTSNGGIPVSVRRSAGRSAAAPAPDADRG